MKSIRIVSDGIPQNTKVYTHEGYELNGIRKISWNIEVGDLAKANVEFILPLVDIISSNVKMIDQYGETKKLKYLIHKKINDFEFKGIPRIH